MPRNERSTSTSRRGTSSDLIASLTIGIRSVGAALRRLHLERLAGGQLDHPHDRPIFRLAVADLAALEFVGPPFALLQRRGRTLLERQLETSSRSAPLRSSMPSQAQDRSASVPARRTISRVSPPTADRLSERQEPRLAARHIEAAVETVRSSHPARGQSRGGPRVRGVGLALRCGAQSTMSTSTWLSSPAAAALTTVRSAWAVRPPRPITRP